ncbi:hypothetical protein GE21DRAFT_4552 [Neurospora crassa]|uniref:Rhodopsin domain-containing protein n=1 Tax=Neurospora crassa (strain ATCC 24698 / 74-OR23-1A / CBS 708.71 / DSM 1257 / FGSC 987) TaxID=367110 RepID=U9W8G8_NEUCR|nr:hypothetical protein NCU00246 [Neurospora crassa OR74A]XP_011393800.1 uncharacterized protein NCU00246 [Neurospora crassa OR74A]ESA43320.1 hypothetical protein NCU00246 [Neurospora crassa OR74A]ESA43321.1 hypothetical protein, variant [Neurospora crassa OR74A]KHE89664.1 hypothetical protein GE21DRAFT_4552 [Neurospora crassa]|eukprot:XP_011393799.1 hypothetical protein NCU00246 [Neurospora crassa OR74A]
MAMSEDASRALVIMWVIVGVVFVLVILRVYTRVVCMAAYGVDDWIYVAAFIILFIYTVLIQYAAFFGFGQTEKEIANATRASKARLFECLGQTTSFVGTPLAKASLGAFLLRLVTVTWHRFAVWGAMTLMFLSSVAQLLCFWLSCRPFNYVYNKNIRGVCPVNTRPTFYLLYGSTIATDFFFAMFPWIILWKLQMPRQEKITIGCSLSLGLITAAAGVKRVTEVEGLYTSNYLKTTLPLIVWSAAEMAITLVCIGIPVLRPLYKRIYWHLRRQSAHSSEHLQHLDCSKEQPGFALQTIGGGPLDKEMSNLERRNSTRPTSVMNNNTDDFLYERFRIGINEASKTTVIAQQRRLDDEDSKMDALDDYSCSQLERSTDSTRRALGDEELGMVNNNQRSQNTITVTQSFSVDRS